MKVFVLLAAAVFGLNSCQKNKEERAVDTTQLTGTWELRQVQAGMIPATNLAAGNGNLLTFTETTYERFANGSLQKSGTYQLLHDTTATATVGLQLPAGQFNIRLVFDNDGSTQKTFIDLREGRLQVVSGYFPTDGGSWQVYEKTTDAPKSVQ